jgi:hypothetical protein
MVPVLVAHSAIGAHIQMLGDDNYDKWLSESFKKCVCRVNEKEFKKISEIEGTYLGHENHTLGGIKSCAVPIPVENDDLPNVLKFAKLWRPTL